MITIVSGIPRSGTSMIMRMLSAGGMPLLTDDFRKPDECNPYGYFEYEPVKEIETDSSWIPKAKNKAIKIIYRHLYHLPRDHEYRVIFMEREMKEILASQKEMILRLGKTINNIPEKILEETFEKHLKQIKQWFKGKPNFKVIYIDFKDVINTPEKSTSLIQEFLGSSLNQNKMAEAVDGDLSSISHSMKPLNT